MDSNDESGTALDGVERIHPAVDRLRQLVTSATILDLRATADGYWERAPESAGASTEDGDTS